eukprot:gene4297-5018_t
MSMEEGSIWTTEWHPEGRHVAVGGTGEIYLWDIGGEQINKQFVSKSDVFALDFSAGGSLLWCGSRDGGVCVFDVRIDPSTATQGNVFTSRLNAVWAPTGRAQTRQRNATSPMSPSKSSMKLQLGSPICSIKSMLYDDNYTIISTMNGEHIWQY